jgi:hypothetical protein
VSSAGCLFDIVVFLLVEASPSTRKLPGAFHWRNSSSNFMPLVVKILLDSGLMEDSFILSWSVGRLWTVALFASGHKRRRQRKKKWKKKSHSWVWLITEYGVAATLIESEADNTTDSCESTDQVNRHLPRLTPAPSCHSQKISLQSPAIWQDIKHLEELTVMR